MQTVTMKEAIERLHVTRRAIYNMIAAGKLTPLPKTRAQGGSSRTLFPAEQIEYFSQPRGSQSK